MWDDRDFLYWLLLCGFVYLLGIFTGTSLTPHQPKVDLPEEYKEITQDDILRGHYKNGTLYLEFDNTQRTGYELHIQNDTLRVTDPNNGNVIYKEKMNWNAPTLMQECIIKDNF